jgi:hypothetical protein
MTKRLKCSSINQQAGGPPKPVAYPTVPSDAVNFTKSDPSTPIPHDVREFVYSGYWDIGLEMLPATIQCEVPWRW